MRMIRGFFCVLFLASVALISVSDATFGAIDEKNVIACDTSVNVAENRTKPEEPDLYATAAVLLDADSGRVLYGKNASVPMAMASTTKIMTCILILENGNLDDMAEVSAYAASMPKVKLSVKKGEQYRVRDLLYSLMLESHNDSAVVLAEYLGKRMLAGELRDKSAAEYSVEESRQAVKAFATLMNAKAEELGCEQTWFVTPNGLDATETFELPGGENLEKEHGTTAEELALIMAYCIGRSPEKELFRQITGTASYTFSGNGRTFACTNHNAFLNMMEGAFSGKTGFTNKAGYCYVGALERDGRTFVVALLACGWPDHKTYKWSDTKKLMNYGIANYQFRDLRKEKNAYRLQDLKPIPVEYGQPTVLGGTARVEVLIAKEQAEATGSARAGLLMRPDEEVLIECHMPKKLTAPVKAGSVVGEITYSVDGKCYFTEKIITVRDVERIDLPWCMRQIWKRYALFS